MTDPIISDAPILRVMISDGQNIFPIAAIEYEGELWLVPKWFVNDAEGWRTPAHIIGLKNFQLQDHRGQNHPADFSAQPPIPKIVLDRLCRGEEVPGYVTVMAPPLRFRSPLN